jgi:hypothetical protein
MPKKDIFTIWRWLAGWQAGSGTQAVHTQLPFCLAWPFPP